MEPINKFLWRTRGNIFKTTPGLIKIKNALIKKIKYYLCLPRNCLQIPDDDSIDDDSIDDDRMGLYSFEEISEIELNSLKQVLDATTEIDISQSDQKRLDCRYSLGSINENEPIQIRKELSSCQIIDN